MRHTWPAGSLDGADTIMVWRCDGLNWWALFNQRDDPSGLSYSDIDLALHNAAGSVSSWRDHDLFENYLVAQEVFLSSVTN